MRLQFLVSTVNEEVETLAQRMNLQADAIVVNQCDRNEYREYTYEALCGAGRGTFPEQLSDAGGRGTVPVRG